MLQGMQGRAVLQTWGHCLHSKPVPTCSMAVPAAASVSPPRTAVKPSTALLQELNQHGVARMCRMLAVLQPALSAMGASGGFRPEAARSFDKVWPLASSSNVCGPCLGMRSRWQL